MRLKVHFITLIAILLFFNIVYSCIQEIRINNFCKDSIENIAKKNERCRYLYDGNKPRYILVAKSYDIIPLGILTRNHLLIGNMDTQEIRLFSKFITFDIDDRFGTLGVSWLNSVISHLLFSWRESNSFTTSKDKESRIETRKQTNEQDCIIKLTEQFFNAE